MPSESSTARGIQVASAPVSTSTFGSSTIVPRFSGLSMPTIVREAIERVRGLNENFLPQRSDRVIRLAHGMWGLADRDVGVSAENQERALDALYRSLQLRQK